MYYLYTFHSTHSALFAEKTLLSSGIQVKIIPVPRAISASCGLSARIKAEEFLESRELIKRNEIEVDSIYLMDEKGQVTAYDDEKTDRD